jgi:hypothetical protein
MVYTGDWAVKEDPAYFQKRIMVCSTPGKSAQFSFTGSSIYWRAVADSDGGRADVYIDNTFQSTVDCYFKESLPFQFAFIKTGLDPTRQHVIRIVVRAEKNERSKGTMIRHMAFEHSAKSYNAAAGFTNVMGKNNWWYQSGNEQRRENLEFLYGYKADVRSANEKGLFPNCWGNMETCLVGNDYYVATTVDAIRTFIAPHAGTMRIEGAAEIQKPEDAACNVSIVKNDKDTLSEGAVRSAKPFVHDVRVSVKKNDVISFIVRKNPGKKGAKVIWDPTITFLN